MNRPPLPLTVIGGFLGAGKTTLVNHLLRHVRGRRLAILVNDFGELNIDALLIRSGAADLIELSNGCVCCQIGDDLTQALIRVLDSPGSLDAVVIEASGVSDPWSIAQIASADPALVLDGVVVLVDAGVALAQVRDPLLGDTLARQLRAADLVVVNKIDGVAMEERLSLRGWIAGHAGSAPQLETTQAKVPVEMLAGWAMPVIQQRWRRASAPQSGLATLGGMLAHFHGEQFETWSCRPGTIFEPQALRSWLRQPPPGVLRLKGVVRTGASQWAEIQIAGRRSHLNSAESPPCGPVLVAIGLHGQLPVTALAAAFEVMAG